MAKNEEKIKDADGALDTPDRDDDRDPSANRPPFYQDVNYDWRFLRSKREEVHHVVVDSDAASASNYDVFWIAPFPCTVTGVLEVHSTAGTDGSAVGLQVERLQGTTASGSGDDLLASDIDLKATADTVQEGTLNTDRKKLQLAKHDRLGLTTSGTLTAVANVVVIVRIVYN